MRKDAWVELSEVQEALVSSISMISVIADGMENFITNSAMTGNSAVRYATATQFAYDRLKEVSEKFQEILDSVDWDEQEGTKQEAIA